MDTSETYIKMHLALPKELREEPQEGDYYYDKETGKVGGRMGEVYFPTDKMIKLYEQDQLQAMVNESRPYFLWMSLDIEANSGLAPDMGWNDYWQSFTSMEQLWLVFVMKEKYNKVWNGEDWILNENL